MSLCKQEHEPWHLLLHTSHPQLLDRMVWGERSSTALIHFQKCLEIWMASCHIRLGSLEEREAQGTYSWKGSLKALVGLGCASGGRARVQSKQGN